MELKHKEKELVQNKINELLKKYNIDLKIDDFVISHDGSIYKIRKIVEEGIELVYEDEDGEWNHHYGTIEWNRWNPTSKEYIKLDRPYEQIEKEAMEEIKDLSKYKNDEEVMSESRALTSGISKEVLTSIKGECEKQRNHVIILYRVLERKKNELWNMMHDFESKIKVLQRVIGVIELYLGVHEEIIQFKEGSFSSIDDPICFRQQILYMDEEIGDPKEAEAGGLDFDSIDKFDAWVASDNHYKKLVPEEKCVVVMRVRRYDKDYNSNDSFYEYLANRENKRTYILIRNGENLYRISSNIDLQPRLFPLKNEFEEILKDYIGNSKEEIEERIFDYKRNVMMLQGLLDRTDIFKPLKSPVNIFKQETYSDTIKFIYDDEVSLTEGKKYWKDWKKEINSKIQRGSRIYVHIDWGEAKYLREDRILYGYYDLPSNGVYTVEYDINYLSYDKKEMKKYVFLYNPGGKIWNSNEYDYQDRKRRISFVFYHNDDFILNYDMISLDDIEYYLNSRIDRENYLSMLPILYELKRARLKEMEWEKGFVEMLILKYKVSDKKVWEAIDWWKYKNIWKRPIMQDDAKALRMIEKRILK